MGVATCEADSEGVSLHVLTCRRLMPTSARNVEILPLREHRRATFRCRSCGRMTLMSIRRKYRVARKVYFDVTCSACGNQYDRASHGPGRTYWRHLRKKLNINRAQMLGTLMKEVVKSVMETGTAPPIEETARTFRIGQQVVIKPAGNSRKSKP